MKIQTNHTEPLTGYSTYFIWKACKDLGHEALLANDYDSTADVVINVDGSPHVESISGKPSIYWETDSFFHGPRTGKTWTHLFIGGCPEDMVKYPDGTVFLPHACDPEIHKKADAEQEHDIVFVGSHNGLYSQRLEIMERLKDKYKVLDSETPFDQSYAQTLSRGKLIFNKSLGEKNIPMRFFEGMAIGVLLQNYNDNLDPLATAYEHYVPYSSYEDLENQIDFYLSHEDERERIAKQAREHVLQHHTYKHRVETMLSLL